MLPVLRGPEVLNVGVGAVWRDVPCAWGGCGVGSFLSVRRPRGGLCGRLDVDSSTDLDDRYSNLFLGACMGRRARAGCLGVVWFCGPLGMWRVFLCSVGAGICRFRSVRCRRCA